MDGQADTAPVTADDVAAFLLDNPDAAGAGDQEEVKPTADAPEGEEPEDNADAETDDESPDDEDGDDAIRPSTTPRASKRTPSLPASARAHTKRAALPAAPCAYNSANFSG